MKKILFQILAVCAIYSSNAQSNIDILNYRFEINLDDKSDTIYGRSEIRFAAKKNMGQLYLDIVGDQFRKKGMTITGAEIPFNKIPHRPLTKFFFHADDRLVIDFSKVLQADDTLVAFIEYKGIPTDGLIISTNKFGKKTFFSDNWPNRAHHWIPCVDDPADKASVEFIVTAPAKYQVVSNGVLVEETNLPDNKKLTHWKEEMPIPSKVMVIGVAEFAVNNNGTVNCIPISSWVFPENRTDGFGDYSPANEILNWYINYIGPYAFKKLANVQSKTMFGGMENASAIFYFENSVNGKKNQEPLIAHEIVHQWFGNSATEKSFAHLWLSEGFATYLTHLYIESKYGTDSLNKRMQSERQEIIDFVKESKRPVVDSTADYMSLLNANSYQKGGWVLHMLRRELGDSVFKKAVRKYYEQYAYKNAETEDLRKVFETVSGKNLQPFFKQWLFTGENPSLNIKWKYDSKQKKVQIIVTQLQKNIFQLPLSVRIGTRRSSENNVLKMNISKQSETFSFLVTDEVIELIVDPQISLLAKYEVSQIK